MKLDVEWRSTSLRPVQMPSVECPMVSSAAENSWRVVSHCLPCRNCLTMKLEGSDMAGEVECGYRL